MSRSSRSALTSRELELTAWEKDQRDILLHRVSSPRMFLCAPCLFSPEHCFDVAICVVSIAAQMGFPCRSGLPVNGGGFKVYFKVYKKGDLLPVWVSAGNPAPRAPGPPFPSQLPHQTNTNQHFDFQLFAAAQFAPAQLQCLYLGSRQGSSALLHGKASSSSALPSSCPGPCSEAREPRQCCASAQLGISSGHRAADMEQSIAANHCGSAETPLVRKKRNVEQCLFYKRGTCRSYLHISGRAGAAPVPQYRGQRGCAHSKGHTQGQSRL